MKRIFFALLLVIQFGLYSVYGQEAGKDGASDIVLDEEDKEFQEDLYLTDTEYFKKYVEKYTGADAKFLAQSYSSSNDPEIRIYILRLLSKKGFSDPFVAQIFRRALEEGIRNPNQHNRMNISDNWKVRAAAAFLIHENPDGIGDEQKRSYVMGLLYMIKIDPEERCQAASALALGKLFEKGDEAKGDGAKEGFARYNVLKKDVIVEVLLQKLDKVHINDQFLCWALVKALGYTKSPRGFFPLMLTRKKGFNDKVKLEISRSLTAITGGGTGTK